MKILILFLLFFNFTSCSSSESESFTDKEEILKSPEQQNNGVTNISVSGEAQNYTFNVTIKSPDTGCKQYADWWEVLDKEGNLIYRRILAHSHVNEQPFTRLGGKVKIEANTEIIVRAHMNNSGYLPMAFSGNISNGLTANKINPKKFPEAEKTEPLPTGCAF